MGGGGQDLRLVWHVVQADIAECHKGRHGDFTHGRAKQCRKDMSRLTAAKPRGGLFVQPWDTSVD